MAKKGKQLKKRGPARRRKIEEHQNKIRSTARRPFFYVNEDTDDAGGGGGGANSDAESELVTEPNPDDSTHCLWVFEPLDLDEMSIGQVLEVWKYREYLCGSKEVAAEALAIIEVENEVVDSYEGWIEYIRRDEVARLNVPFLPSDSEQSYYKEIARNALSRSQVLKLNGDEVREAWSNRPDSFLSVEAACQALALLRENYGVVSNSSWQGLLNHPEIEKIKDYLTNEDEASALSTGVEEKNRNTLSVDLRKRESKTAVVREGQASFRFLVVENFYGCCCVTGSNVNQVLEAAHIMPYSGRHSNSLENSLCLRVDFHRLFDKFLISIDPESNELKVSDVIRKDRYYCGFEGVNITRGRIKASRLFLNKHFDEFLKRQDA